MYFSLWLLQHNRMAQGSWPQGHAICQGLKLRRRITVSLSSEAVSQLMGLRPVGNMTSRDVTSCALVISVSYVLYLGYPKLPFSNTRRASMECVCVCVRARACVRAYACPPPFSSTERVKRARTFHAPTASSPRPPLSKILTHAPFQNSGSPWTQPHFLSHKRSTTEVYYLKPVFVMYAKKHWLWHGYTIPWVGPIYILVYFHSSDYCDVIALCDVLQGTFLIHPISIITKSPYVLKEPRLLRQLRCTSWLPRPGDYYSYPDQIGTTWIAHFLYRILIW